MRKMLMTGTAALSLALGASAAFADNPNAPTWSPYTLVPAGASSPSAYPVSAPAYEARAAIVDSSGTTVPNNNAPTWSPYTLAPQAK